MSDPLLLHEPLRVTLPPGGGPGALCMLLRRIRPSDKARLREGMEDLSARSTYQRFFRPRVRPTEAVLRYLTEVDGVDHVALAAFEAEADAWAGGEGLGVARYIRQKENPRLAEAAVTVADAHQQRGIGSVLLAALGVIAATHGIEAFQAYVVDENRTYAYHLEGLGAEAQHSGSGLVELRLPIYRDPAAVPSTPAGRKHRAALEALLAAAR